MTAPLIGLTGGIQIEDSGYRRQRVNDDYVQAVLRAGGIPVMIPVGLSSAEARDLLERLDGVILTGGPDVDPVLFNGKPHPRVYGIDEQRDSLEIELVNSAVAYKKPLLGICRGIQVINVALGGTLYTDIDDQMPNALQHDNAGEVRNHKAHPVTVEPDTLLANIVRAGALRVNSFHHQAIKDLGRGLKAIASSPDHIIESVQLNSGHPFFLGVQWHPEGMIDDPQMLAIFQTLIDAAGKNKHE